MLHFSKPACTHCKTIRDRKREQVHPCLNYASSCSDPWSIWVQTDNKTRTKAIRKSFSNYNFHVSFIFVWILLALRSVTAIIVQQWERSEHPNI